MWQRTRGVTVGKKGAASVSEGDVRGPQLNEDRAAAFLQSPGIESDLSCF